MMKPRARALLFSLMLALGLVAGMARGVVAAPLAADALPTTKEPTSARFTITATITAAGETIQMNGTGAVSGQDMEQDLTLSGPPSAGAPRSFTISMKIIGNKLYLKMSGLDAENQDKWYVSDLGPDMSGMQGGMTGMSGLDKQYEAAFTVQEQGKETMNGVSTTKYQVNVDLAKLYELMGMSGPEVSSLSENVTMTMWMWVGDTDMYLHQMRMTMDMAVDAEEATSSGNNRVTLDMTMTFSDFDTPITIAAPPDAEPLDLGTGPASGTGSLTSLLMPGMGVPLSAVGMPMGAMPTGMPTTGEGENTVPLAVLVLGVLCLAAGCLLRRTTLAY